MAEEEQKEKKPLTREDVLRKIEENVVPAEVLELYREHHGDIPAAGLDLSRAKFEEGVDLSGLDLQLIILKETVLVDANLKGAELQYANLEETVLQYANLEGANLLGANLEGANLFEANLEGAVLAFANLEGAVLVKANLKRANLRGAHLEEANLGDAHLEEANLRDAHLERGTLLGAQLEGADLRDVHLEEANLGGAHLEGANLGGTQFSPETRLENVDWGNFILGEERSRQFGIAAATYRRLKQWYTNAGIYDKAGKFFFREMTVRRKQMAWKPNPIHRAWSKFLSLICGYGERPLRVIGWATSVILGLALVYFAIGIVWQWPALWQSLYFSAVSFTALGYGSWIDNTWIVTSNSWIKGLGAFESFIGVFTIALFLITFVRKMTR